MIRSSGLKKTDLITRNFAYLAEKEAREEGQARRPRRSGAAITAALFTAYLIQSRLSSALRGALMAWNSKVYADWSPKKDAEVVRRMRNAGGVLLGKVHTHEFAWGVTTPPTRNPWDGRSVTGGSQRRARVRRLRQVREWPRGAPIVDVRCGIPPRSTAAPGCA